jgi:UPF0042 nucleotide-binding protein
MIEEPLCVIVTGLSGAGKSLAIDYFEDYGFFCVDNLPIDLVPKLMEICDISHGRYNQLALGIDIRAGEKLSEFNSILKYISQAGYKYSILFLEASDEILVRRFSATRRKHPLGGELSIIEQIQQERAKLQGIRSQAEKVVDTTKILPQELKNLIANLYLKRDRSGQMLITISTFGYKYGLPLDADLVFDVRFLPNPFHDENLRPLRGDEPQICEYLSGFEQTQRFMKEFFNFIDYLIPAYIEEGKSYLTIAIGCTGGKHRSVYVSDNLMKYLSQKGLNVVLVHRDIGKE